MVAFIFRWFKEENEQLLPLQLSDRITIVSAGLLKISKVSIIYTYVHTKLHTHSHTYIHIGGAQTLLQPPALK